MLVNAARVPCRRATRGCEEIRDRIRARWSRWAAGAPEAVFAIEDADADGVPVRVYRPSPDPDLPVIVYFHGGGWTIGSVEQFDRITRQIANAHERDRRVGRLPARARASVPGAARRLLACARLDREERGDVRRRPDAPRGDGRQCGRQPRRGVRVARRATRVVRRWRCRCSCTRSSIATSTPRRTTRTARVTC